MRPVTELPNAVLARYPLAVAKREIVSSPHGGHLVVRVQTGVGEQLVLRERPAHLTSPAWAFHLALLGGQVPAGVPRVLRTQDGAAGVTFADREFALYSWLPGTPRGVGGVTDFAAAGERLGQLHHWLATIPVDRLPTRTVATTCDLATWLPRSLGDPGAAPAARALADRALALLADTPTDAPAPVHGDFHPFNLLWQDEALSGVCDWEDAHLNSPMFDVAWFLAHSVFIHWPRHQPPCSDARVRATMDHAGAASFLRAYALAAPRRGRPRGLRRALLVSWLLTVSFVLPQGEADLVPAREVLEWLGTPRHLEPWEDLLST